MRKTVIVFISILFTGALLLYTAQANLDLLSQVSPNPQFVGFAMVALEGGVIYWTGYYLLHWHGVHKGIAVVMIFIDFLFSMVGFFVDSNIVAMRHDLGTSLAGWFPSVILVVGADVCLNVGIGIIVHLVPDNRQITKEDFQPLLDAGSAVKDGMLKRIPVRAGQTAQPSTPVQPALPEIHPDMQKWMALYRESGDTMSFPEWMAQVQAVPLAQPDLEKKASQNGKQ